MRFAIVTLLLTALGRSADASCAIEEAYLGMHEVPLGCSLVVYVRDPSARPQAIATRGDRNVTVSYIQERTPVPLYLELDSCTGEGMTVQYPLQQFTLELGDVVVGDRLEIAGAATASNESAVIVEARSECPAPLAPPLACPDDTPEVCDEAALPDSGGCASSRPPAGGMLLVLVGIAIRRRRR